MTSFGTASPAGLLGRQQDLEVVRSFAGQASVSGGALVIAGEPGIGKTALLDAVATEAEAAGTKVLRAAGVEYEAGISYAGLNLALLPLAVSIPLLDSAHRDALRVVFGLDVAVTPDRHTVCNAFLELLRRESADQAVLLLVDDLQWLDPLSAVVFGFVARRAAGSRVGFIGTIRPGGEGFFDRARLAEHELAPLSESASAELLHRRFPFLDGRLRDRVLADARGNPLALLELSAAAGDFGRSQRLQATFGARIAELPASDAPGAPDGSSRGHRQPGGPGEGEPDRHTRCPCPGRGDGAGAGGRGEVAGFVPSPPYPLGCCRAGTRG